MSASKPSFLDELKSLAVQGRDDFVLALQSPSPESMQLHAPQPAASPEQAVTPQLDGDFQAVLAEYAQRGQGHEQAERGHDMER